MTVRDVIWAEGADWRMQTPLALLVVFDKYDGSELLLGPKTGKKLVPIFRTTTAWTRGAVQCKRTQFPINTPYVTAIHKSQGLSLDRAVLNLNGDDDFSPSLTYVAIPRIRSLSGILFEKTFCFQRLRFKSTDTTVARNLEYQRRKAHEILLPLELLPGLPSTHGEDEEEVDEYGELPLIPPGASYAPPFQLVIRSDPVAGSYISTQLEVSHFRCHTPLRDGFDAASLVINTPAQTLFCQPQMQTVTNIASTALKRSPGIVRQISRRSFNSRCGALLVNTLLSLESSSLTIMTSPSRGTISDNQD